MKKYIIITILAALSFTVHSQSLIDKYKTGTVRLIPDTEFATGNDWNTVFRSYYDTLYGKPMSKMKSLIILPDGSVVVNHTYRNYHSKFSPSGKYEKEFLIEKAGHKAIIGVINGNTLYTELDNMGKMICSDLEGNYKKTLTLDYMEKGIIALSNGKFAVVGWVLHKEKIRSFVSIVDYTTNEENVIWDHFTDRSVSSSGETLGKRQPFNYSVELKDGVIVAFSTMPFSSGTGKGLPPKIATVDEKLIVAIPNTGEIFIFDLKGNLKSEDKIAWPSSSISVEEQKAIQQKAIDRYKEYISSGEPRVMENLDAYNQIISEMEKDRDNINNALTKPSFSTIVKDSDGNILFFEIPEEKDANRFHVWVYNNGGLFEAECNFVCDEYNLSISPSKMVFHEGYIYSLQTLKEAEGNPLRLVRFKISGSE